MEPCEAVFYGDAQGRLPKACYYKLFRRHVFFFFLMCRKARRRGLRVIYKMRPADFYIAHNGLMRVTGTLGRSRFPKLR